MPWWHTARWHFKGLYAVEQFGLEVNVSKTQILYQNPQGAQPPTIEINGEQLKVTKSFTYLGSIVTNTCDLDKEITTRIARASAAYGRLNSRVWRSRDLRLKTKAAVYRATVIPVLTYCCETWTLYASQRRRLEAFHMRCLRKIAGVKWWHKVTNEEVLRRMAIPSMTKILATAQLRWVGHVMRMENERIPKQVLHCELDHGTRRVGRPYKRFKDQLKQLVCTVNNDDWQTTAQDRSRWRTFVEAAADKAEEAESLRRRQRNRKTKVSS